MLVFSFSTNMSKLPSDECRLNISRVQNRLSLADKIEALKAYEELENYTQVGRLFKCSDKQIKSIVQNKEKIISKYAALNASANVDAKPDAEPSLEKVAKKEVNYRESQEKKANELALLDKVVFEWFLRARRNPTVCLISHNLIQKIALDVKRALKIDGFAPNTAWLLKFRRMYNITDFDMKLQLKEPGPIELDIDEIISKVIRRETNEGPTSLATYEVLDSDDDKDDSPDHEKSPIMSNSSSIIQSQNRTIENPSSEESGEEEEDSSSRNSSITKKKTNYPGRIQNRLSLHDKVQALKAYAKIGNYSKVGRMFKCSDKQIKTIVEKKERIWALYLSFPKMTKVYNKGDRYYRERNLIRSKKLMLLDKVVFEWYLRSQRNPTQGSITKKSIMNTAYETKKVLEIEDFIPNDAWLVNFLQIYSISNFEKKLQPFHRGPTDLNIEAIVTCVAEKDAYDKPCSPMIDALDTSDDDDDDCSDVESKTRSRVERINKLLDQHLQAGSSRSKARKSNAENDEDPPTNVRETRSRVNSARQFKSPSNVENDNDDDDDEEPLSKYPKLEPNDLIKIENYVVNDGCNIETSAINNFEINSLDQALEHLKPLEDFALLREDYRVIGLISQLEMVFKKSKQK